MQRVVAIAINTFREAVRDKVLYGVVGFATAVLLFTLALAELSLDQQERVVADVGLASISLFSVAVAVFLGSSLLYKEIERKTLYVILPKPIERWEFLVGKYVGILMTGCVFIAIMGALQCLISAVQAGLAGSYALAAGLGCAAVLGLGLRKLRDPSIVLPPVSLLFFGVCAGIAAGTPATLEPMLAQLELIVVEYAVVASVALVFSSFSTPFLTGAFTLGIFVMGRSADAMISMPGQAIPPEVKQLLAGLAWVVPNGHLFYPGRNALLGEIAGYGTTLRYLGEVSVYGLAYVVVALSIACTVFARRDFS